MNILQLGRHSLVVFLLVAASVSGPAHAQEKYRVYLGTYTGKVSKGIYQCELNLKDGSLSQPTLCGRDPEPVLCGHSSQQEVLLCRQ